MGGHAQHVCSRVGGRRRHRPLRCHGVVVRTRRRVRAVPNLQQRTLALRTAPRSHWSRLPAPLRRPYARSGSEQDSYRKPQVDGRYAEPFPWGPLLSLGLGRRLLVMRVVDEAGRYGVERRHPRNQPRPHPAGAVEGHRRGSGRGSRCCALRRGSRPGALECAGWPTLQSRIPLNDRAHLFVGRGWTPPCKPVRPWCDLERGPRPFAMSPRRPPRIRRRVTLSPTRDRGPR
jgi:hypothetical protein